MPAELSADIWPASQRTHAPLTLPLSDLSVPHVRFQPRIPTSFHRASDTTREPRFLFDEHQQAIVRDSSTLVFNLWTTGNHGYGMGYNPTMPNFLFYFKPHPEDQDPLAIPYTATDKLFGKPLPPKIPSFQAVLERRQPESGRVEEYAVIVADRDFLRGFYDPAIKKRQEKFPASIQAGRLFIHTTLVQLPAKIVTGGPQNMPSSNPQRFWLPHDAHLKTAGVPIFGIPGDGRYTISLHGNPWTVHRSWYRWEKPKRGSMGEAKTAREVPGVLGMRMWIEMGGHGKVGEVDWIVGQMWILEGIPYEVRTALFALVTWVYEVEHVDKEKQVKAFLKVEKVVVAERRKVEAVEKEKEEEEAAREEAEKEARVKAEGIQWQKRRERMEDRGEGKKEEEGRGRMEVAKEKKEKTVHRVFSFFK